MTIYINFIARFLLLPMWNISRKNLWFLNNIFDAKQYVSTIIFGYINI